MDGTSQIVNGWSVNIEFSTTISKEESDAIREEIRSFLKEKYLQKKIGSIQMDSGAFQFQSPVEMGKDNKGTGEENKGHEES